MHERTRCCDEAANHQLPIAAAFWIIQIVSMEERSNLMENWMQICCSTRSVILNETATQYTCSLNSVYRPHWLVQWRRHCSRMQIPVHSPWLPGYIDVVPNTSVGDVMQEWEVLLWWSCQSPAAHSCGLLNHLNSFSGGMFKLNTKFDADSFCFSFSHFQCDGHTVHMLTQQCLPPPMTSTVKLSLITHTCSSPLSLAARLYQCRANHSCYINNSWTFFG